MSIPPHDWQQIPTGKAENCFFISYNKNMSPKTGGRAFSIIFPCGASKASWMAILSLSGLAFRKVLEKC
jgi:hypothetical protein